MNVLQAAERYLKAKIACIPIWPTKRKNPHLSGYKKYFKKLPTVGDWRRWARRWPDTNIALLTGYWGYVALDFDDEPAYRLWKGTNTIQTWEVSTGRGWHVWFRVPEAGKSRMFSRDGCEVLLRAEGGYIIAPPSIHWTGKPYKTQVNLPPATVKLSEILSGWKEKQAKSVQRVIATPTAAKHGLKIEDLIPLPNRYPSARGTYQVSCPFHDDDNPSAWLNINQQRFGCNACWPGQYFDVVNLFAMINGMTNGEAYKKINPPKIKPIDIYHTTQTITSRKIIGDTL